MNIFIAMFAAFLWGTTYAVTQDTLSGWPPLLLGVLRALPAGLLLLMIKPTWPQRGAWWLLLITGLFNIAIFFGCIFIMALTLPSAISSVGMMSVPVFAMLVQWFVMKQRLSLIQIVSGLVVVVFAGLLFNPETIVLNPIGLIAMIIGILCLICGSTLTQRLSQQVDWWCVLTWQLIFGGGVLALVMSLHAVFHPTLYRETIMHFSMPNLYGLLWVCVMNTVVAYACYVWALQRLSVVEFTFAGVANPLAGVLCGVLMVNESYTWGQYTLMAGMVIMSLVPQFVKYYRRKNNHDKFIPLS
ncbi:EamA family transporter [Vibrio sp. PP-XX7]